jgi:hypothetical protein
MSLTTKIIAYESGELEWEDVVELFSELVNSGKINHLQGHYQRTAQDLLEGGFIFIDD